MTACRECGGSLAGSSRTFCSSACVKEWKIRSQPSFAAQLVLERDNGICASCGLDCVALHAELTALARAHEYNVDTPSWRRPIVLGRMLVEGTYADRVRELGLTTPMAQLKRRLWEMDHIVPVVEGGGSCGLQNLRTLCWKCHRSATAELRKRMAKKVAP